MSSVPREAWGPEDNLQQAHLVREMMALAERYLAGAASADELRRWAWSVQRSRTSTPFRRHPTANGLFGYLLCLDSALEPGGAAAVRRCDLLEALDTLRRGAIPFDGARLATLRIPAAEVARRVGLEAVRYDEPGIGWWEAVRFGSIGTGRCFCANTPLQPMGPGPERQALIRTFGHPASDAELAEAIADLFDTLCIDEADTVELALRPARHWDLWRLDDNGHRFLIESFSGHAKACARLAAFEATHHKQSYWLEQRGGAKGPTGLAGSAEGRRAP